ncbi:MAG: hypothetical protein U5L02_01895 [Rheinheimera sp.]|nr:hypothetical protein [Rheinheimera sp.]
MNLVAVIGLWLALFLLSASLYLLSPRQTLWPAARRHRAALSAATLVGICGLVASAVPLFGVWPALYLALTLLMAALPLWPLLFAASVRRSERQPPAPTLTDAEGN